MAYAATLHNRGMKNADRFATHTVDNQPPPLSPYNAYLTDTPLQEAIAREGAGWAQAQLSDYGAVVGDELMALAPLANTHRPTFKPIDRYGARINEVQFHPNYHRIMALGIQHGVSGFAWRNQALPGAHVARAGLAFLHGQADQGSSCPLTMTYACVPTLAHAPALQREWFERIVSTHYDPRHIPAWKKPGNTIGMGMTEKQGGSDVRSNTTRAQPTAQAGLYELIGHKWFFSAPMSDAFLVLAQLPEGLSCFLLPRFAPDGTRNALRFERLKDKLGDWSNASAEVEFLGALAWLVGEPGRGIATILQMVALTRLDCMIGSAGLMRQALVQAIHHCRHRRAFGRCLSEQPLMQNVLADLALESEAATALAFRVSRAVDESARDPTAAALARIATAIGKYWICKRTPMMVNEAQECLGGAGYIEESGMPQLYRQAPLNSIWEGSGNVQCLDVLRALTREPATLDAFAAQFESVRGANSWLDQSATQLLHQLRSSVAENQARVVVEQMALCLQAAILVSANNPVAEVFCASRLGGQHSAAFGTLHSTAPFRVLLERAL